MYFLVKDICLKKLLLLIKSFFLCDLLLILKISYIF